MVMMYEEGAKFKEEAVDVKKQSRWFMRHGAQRTDVLRGAQNAADATGAVQYIYALEELLPEGVAQQAPLIVAGDEFFLYTIVRCNNVRSQAGR